MQSATHPQRGINLQDRWRTKGQSSDSTAAQHILGAAVVCRASAGNAAMVTAQINEYVNLAELDFMRSSSFRADHSTSRRSRGAQNPRWPASVGLIA